MGVYRSPQKIMPSPRIWGLLLFREKAQTEFMSATKKQKGISAAAFGSQSFHSPLHEGASMLQSAGFGTPPPIISERWDGSRWIESRQVWNGEKYVEVARG